MSDHPFRRIRETVKLLQAQCGLLLAVEGLGYSDKDYALFFVMGEMRRKTEGRTYSQAVGELGAWLRLFRRLVDLVTDANLRGQCEAEWVKLTAGFEDVVQEAVK